MPGVIRDQLLQCEFCRFAILEGSRAWDDALLNPVCPKCRKLLDPDLERIVAEHAMTPEVQDEVRRQRTRGMRLAAALGIVGVLLLLGAMALSIWRVDRPLSEVLLLVLIGWIVLALVFSSAFPVDGRGKQLDRWVVRKGLVYAGNIAFFVGGLMLVVTGDPLLSRVLDFLGTASLVGGAVTWVLFGLPWDSTREARRALVQRVNVKSLMKLQD